MATAVLDNGGEDSVTNGEVKPSDSGTLEDTSMDIKDADAAILAKTSERPFSLNSTSGPPILHPTVTTWQWLFSASDMPHTPSITHLSLNIEQEKYFRWKGIQLIFRIAEYLRL